MANYATLKAAIVAAIKQNGNNEITGNLLQQQLLAIVNSLGVGYQYAGIATPATNPGTPDQNVFYIASTAGTYTNFGGLVLADGEIAILKYNGAWSKDSTGAASLEKLNQLGQEVFSKIVSVIIGNTIFSKTKISLKTGDKYRLSIIPDGSVTRGNAVFVNYIFKDGTVSANSDVASNGQITMPYSAEITCSEDNVVAISIERDQSKVVAAGYITFTVYRKDSLNIQDKPFAGSSALVCGDGVLQVIRLKKIGSADSTVFAVGDYYATDTNLFLVTAVDSSGHITSYTSHGLDEDKIYLCDGLSYEYKQGIGLSIIGATAYYYDKLGLKQGYYYNGAWVNDGTRVSTKFIDCLNISVPVSAVNGIVVYAVARFNQNGQYVDYVTINKTDYDLPIGYYYSVIFKGNGNIAPADIYNNVYLDKDVLLKGAKQDIEYGLSDATAKAWWTHNNDGTLTKNTANNTYSLLLTDIEEGDFIDVILKGGGSGRAWYFLDGVELEPAEPANKPHIISMAPNDFVGTTTLQVPAGALSILVQTNNSNYFNIVKCGTISLLVKKVSQHEEKINTLNEDVIDIKEKINTLNEDVIDIKEEIDKVKPIALLPTTPFLWASIQRMLVKNTGFVNIAFIGDSYTQGTENIIDGIQQYNQYGESDYQSYVRPLTKLLQDKYGFGGLGWLDFARDHGTGKMFGCSNLYSNWRYTFSSTGITGLDGSDDGAAANCLGICCGHTIFANGAYLSMTFDEGYLDRFFIRYYKNAHFSVSINGGEAVEVIANSTDGWQETEFGVTGTDITSVLITSLANNSVIFGMDCFYGTKGIRCHKVGNRSIKASDYLEMDAEQWEGGITKLNLSWASVMLAINDLGTSTSESKMNTIVTNISNLISRIQTACTTSNLVTCDISLLGIYDIVASTYLGLPMLCEKQKNFALNNGFGWVDNANVIGRTKEQYNYTGVFSDMVHLNAIGTQAYAEHIFKHLFTF